MVLCIINLFSTWSLYNLIKATLLYKYYKFIIGLHIMGKRYPCIEQKLYKYLKKFLSAKKSRKKPIAVWFYSFHRSRYKYLLADIRHVHFDYIYVTHVYVWRAPSVWMDQFVWKVPVSFVRIIPFSTRF